MKLLLKLCMLPAFLMSAASAASDAEETIIKPGSSKEGKRTLYRNPKANRKLDIDTSLPPPEPSKRQLFSKEGPYTGDALILQLITSGNRDTEKPNSVYHTRSYTAIASDEDITMIIPPNAQQTYRDSFNADTGEREYNTLQGSYWITRSGLYRSSSVEMEPKVLFNARGERPMVFRTTDLQPKYIPAINEDFQLLGKCTVTNAKTLSAINSHSCFYDVCLGSTSDCLNVYAGGSYQFSPFLQSSAYGIMANNQNNGFADPTDSDLPNVNIESEDEEPGRRNLQNINSGPKIEFQESVKKLVDLNSGLGMPALRAALPPSFPGFCIGGTGRFAGVKCSMEVVTVAQRTAFPHSLETGAPTAAPTETDEPTNPPRRDLQEDEQQEEAETVVDDENEEEVRRNMQREGEDANDNNGVLVQKIFIQSDMRLPMAPKAL